MIVNTLIVDHAMDSVIPNETISALTSIHSSEVVLEDELSIAISFKTQRGKLAQNKLVQQDIYAI